MMRIYEYANAMTDASTIFALSSAPGRAALRGDHEVAVVQLRIESDRSEHHAGHAPDDEDEEEANDEEQGGIETDLPAGRESRDPAEDLQSGRNGDHDAGSRKETHAERG